MSLELLKLLASENTNYSSFLQKYSQNATLGSLDDIVQGIDELQTRGFIEVEHSYEDEEGDVLIIKVTEIGNAYLNYKTNLKKVE